MFPIGVVACDLVMKVWLSGYSNLGYGKGDFLVCIEVFVTNPMMSVRDCDTKILLDQNHEEE